MYRHEEHFPESGVFYPIVRGFQGDSSLSLIFRWATAMRREERAEDRIAISVKRFSNTCKQYKRLSVTTYYYRYYSSYH